MLAFFQHHSNYQILRLCSENDQKVQRKVIDPSVFCQIYQKLMKGVNLNKYQIYLKKHRITLKCQYQISTENFDVALAKLSVHGIALCL